MSDLSELRTLIANTQEDATRWFDDPAVVAFSAAFDPVLCARLLDVAEAGQAFIDAYNVAGAALEAVYALDAFRAALERLVGEGQAT